MRELVTQLLNALEYHQSQTRPIHNTELAINSAREYLATEPTPTLRETLAQQGIKLRTEFEPKQRNVELATEPSGERAELIAQLIRKADAWDHLHPTATRPNVCRKAADMLETDAQPKQVTCQIYGHVVGACLECNTHIEAQQAKRVPLSDAAIWKSDAIMAANSGYGATFQSLRDVIKAVEAHHGITPANKPKDDEPEDLYALALKADNLGQP